MKIKQKNEDLKMNHPIFEIEIDGKIPSVNRYWRHTKQGHHYISQEGREFKEKLQWMAKAKKVKPTSEAVELHLYWYCKKTCNGGDLDNRLKVILDALEGIVYKNDKQVVKIVAKKIMDSKKDLAIIKVCEVKNG